MNKLKSFVLKIEINAKEVVNLILTSVARLISWISSRIQASGKKGWQQICELLTQLEKEAESQAASNRSDAGMIGSVRLSMLRNGMAH